MSEMDTSYLKRIADDIHIIKTQLGKVINYMVDAESEVPEKMRRFIMYMHDVHDVSYMYEERGHQVPPWILREMERCDDRYRQLLKELNLDGGTFEKVRREMAKDTDNRWDHTRQLFAPKGPANEAGQSNTQQPGIDEVRAEGNGRESNESGVAGSGEGFRRRT